MARESTTVQCYPSDSVINKKVQRYEAFGWELINNQRFQEYTGQTKSGDTITRHYSTYNKLTFSREKNEPWYEEVTELERQHSAIEMQQEEIEDTEPRKPSANLMITWIMIGGFGTALLAAIFHKLMPIGILIGCLTIALTIAVTRIIRKICYGRNIAKWHAEHDPAIRELEDRAEKLRKNSLALING